MVAAAEAELESYNVRFCELFEAYQPALRRLVSAYLVNPTDREDLLQEIAAGIWKSLPRGIERAHLDLPHRA
jgi:DNA-directed RNA polymerase specialized sigma24 family protein